MTTETNSPTSSPQRDDRQAINKLSEEWLAAEKAKDIDRLLSMVTDDVVFLPPNASAITGKKAVESLYRTFFAQFNIEHKATTEEIQVNGDWAFAWGGETLTLIPVAGGQQVQLQGKGMSILKRQPDGSWRFARGINNMTPQAASATPAKQ